MKLVRRARKALEVGILEQPCIPSVCTSLFAVVGTVLLPSGQSFTQSLVKVL